MTPSLLKRLGSVGHVLSPGAARCRAIFRSRAQPRASTACLSVLLGLVACDGSRSAGRDDAGHAADAAEELTEPAESEDASPDAALPADASDANLAPDVAIPTDATASTDATGPADTAPPTPIPCTETCTDSQVCIDGRCLFHCGSDIEALRATLAPSLKVHWTMCKSDAVVQVVPRDSVAELHVKDGITLSVGYRSDTTDPFSGGIERTPVLSPGAALIPSPFLALANNGPLVFVTVHPGC